MPHHWLLSDQEYEQCPVEQLLERLAAPSPLERARVLSILALRSIDDQGLVRYVVDTIRTPTNLQAKTIGIITVAFHGVACLLAADTPATRQAVQQLLDTWPADDDNRDLLLWWLGTLGVTVPQAQP